MPPEPKKIFVLFFHPKKKKNVAECGMERKRCEALCVRRTQKQHRKMMIVIHQIRMRIHTFALSATKNRTQNIKMKKIFALHSAWSEEVRRLYIVFISPITAKDEVKKVHSNSADKTRHGSVHLWCNGGGGCSSSSDCAQPERNALA